MPDEQFPLEEPLVHESQVPYSPGSNGRKIFGFPSLFSAVVLFCVVVWSIVLLTGYGHEGQQLKQIVVPTLDMIGHCGRWQASKPKAIQPLLAWQPMLPGRDSQSGQLARVWQRATSLRAHGAEDMPLSPMPSPPPYSFDEDSNAKRDRTLKHLVQEVISCSLSSWRNAPIWQRGDIWQNGNGQRSTCMNAIERLESASRGNLLDIDELYGRWELIFANDDVTRSSPFFWVVRDLLSTDIGIYITDSTTTEKSKDLALSKSFFTLLDTFGRVGWAIGDAFQIIKDEQLISEVEVKNLAGSSVVTTVSHWKLSPSQQSSLEITVESTRAAQSSLRQFLPGFDDIKFPSGRMFETIKPGSSTVLAELTFLSDELRVTRHADKVYVYRKCSSTV
eukprot:gnl/MRDRNA2_/MRDRNA2_19478_c0_seq1.p1 gnl/MRDRNA2_/MRDRNA2_19478_c0~~gnl/MRDRNA2_/MRDRNA2_19478_c0_seq1.p1  ORF type:complete len:403 (+),score=50.59 gnl/MRDRNA2_/MRDRNA2_19478_c0_seq1:38-1210(+)